MNAPYSHRDFDDTARIDPVVLDSCGKSSEAWEIVDALAATVRTTQANLARTAGTPDPEAILNTAASGARWTGSQALSGAELLYPAKHIGHHTGRGGWHS